MAISAAAAAEIHRNICHSRNSLVSFSNQIPPIFTLNFIYVAFFPGFQILKTLLSRPTLLVVIFFKTGFSPLFQKLTSISNVLYICLQYIDQSSSSRRVNEVVSDFTLYANVVGCALCEIVCGCSNLPFQFELHFIMAFLYTRLAHFHTVRTTFLTDK